MAPLVPLDRAKQQPRGLSPTVEFGEAQYALLTQAMGAVPLRDLKEKVGSISHLRDETVRALDLLFTGV